MKRKKGGQPGNRNAMKHGFYSRVLSQADILALQQADSVEGLDTEISILRLKLSQLLERDPDNLHLMLQASSTLSKLLRVKCQLNPQQTKGLKQAIANVFREVALPLGVKLDGKLTSK